MTRLWRFAAPTRKRRRPTMSSKRLSRPASRLQTGVGAASAKKRSRKKHGRPCAAFRWTRNRCWARAEPLEPANASIADKSQKSALFSREPTEGDVHNCGHLNRWPGALGGTGRLELL